MTRIPLLAARMTGQHTAGRTSNISWPDVWSAVAFLVLLAATLLYLRTELSYDEAIYLQVSQGITQTGFPVRRAPDDFSIQVPFQNSPPLVLYTAAVTLTAFPRRDIPPRLLYIALFILPTCGITWWLTRARFGPVPALAVLLAFLTNGRFLREASHLLLNIPLGLFALLTLVSFDNAVDSRERRGRWAALTGISLGLAVWTKYQAICIAMSIGLYLLSITISRRDELRAVRLPLAAAVFGALTALAALVCFYWSAAGPEAFGATLSWNEARVTPASMTPGQLARAMIDTGRECMTTVGPALLLLSVIGVCVENRHRRLVVLLAGYVLATLGFNLAVFRLPGAGTSYLVPSIPAFAVLAGLGASFLAAAATTLGRAGALAVSMLGIQLIATPAGLYAFPRPNHSRAVAEYISANSGPTAGVLAETRAIEFYSGRPVRSIPFDFSPEKVLGYVAGETRDEIIFVVLNDQAMLRVQPIQRELERSLSEHFEPVFTVGNTKVFRRRDPAVRGGGRPA